MVVLFIYIIVETAVLYSVMTYFGYGDFQFRWKVLAWSLITSAIITVAVTLVTKAPRRKQQNGV
jgi:hypothetical protein